MELVSLENMKVGRGINEEIQQNFKLKLYEPGKDDFQDIKDHIHRECKRESTAIHYIYYMQKVYTFLRKYEIDPFNPTTENIYQFFDYYDHWSPHTKNLALAAIRYYYNKINNKGLIINLNLIMPETETYVLNKQKLQLFFDSITNIYDRTVLQFKYSCGIRSSELINLKWGDINFDTLTGMVYKTKNHTDGIIYFLYKGEEILKQLKYYRFNYKDGDFIFPTIRNRGILWNLVNKWAKKFGDENITPHTMRHCFATHLADIGFTNFQLKAALRQKSIKSTERYTHIAELNKMLTLPKLRPLG